MTDQEAAAWYDRLSYAEKVQILKEHHQLRQHLCAQTLLVPTGTKDWISRAVRAAEHLHECQRQLRKIIHMGGELIEEAKSRAYQRQCSNCQGAGIVESPNSDPANSCSCCCGTGVLRYR